MKNKLGLLTFVTGLLIAAVGAVAGYSQQAVTTTTVTTVAAQTAETVPAAGGVSLGMALAILGAAFSAFGGAFGSSVGVGVAGEVGDAVLSEDEKKFGSVLVLQALPATQSIYGMLIAFIVMGKLKPDMSTHTGMAILFAASATAVAQLISGIWQGKVAAASMQLISRKPKQFGQAIILPAMVETFAVFGLLVGILLLGKVQ